MTQSALDMLHVAQGSNCNTELKIEDHFISELKVKYPADVSRS